MIDSCVVVVVVMLLLFIGCVVRYIYIVISSIACTSEIEAMKHVSYYEYYLYIVHIIQGYFSD
jgi:hypothetical protein